jgi:hypothetical protein
MARAQLTGAGCGSGTGASPWIDPFRSEPFVDRREGALGPRVPARRSAMSRS